MFQSLLSMSKVRNPYTKRKQSNFLNRSIAIVAMVFVIALTGRGYHRRKEHMVRRANLQKKKQQQQQGKQAKQEEKPLQEHVQREEEEEEDEEYDSFDSGDEWEFTDDWDDWGAMDVVSDTFGAAAESAGDWMHESVEGVFGEDLTHSVGSAVDAGLNAVGQLTEDVVGGGWWGSEDDEVEEDGANPGGEDDAGDAPQEEAIEASQEEEGEAQKEEVDRVQKEVAGDKVQPVDSTATENAGSKVASDSGARLQVSTFNVAAINNNPFEYWLTMPENPAYEDLMGKIEDFIEAPGDGDVLVSQVFTNEMFAELDQKLTSVAGWKSVQSYWEDDFSKRTIVNGFLKDESLGRKRLASMPDRISNTISLAAPTTDGGTSYAFRPTVINMYDGDLSTQQKWWQEWQSFMFDNKLSVKDRAGETQELAPWSMLIPISKSKYPAISEQEAEDSLPLQTLCCAIFDAILVHMMNTASAPDVWQPLKRTIVENLTTKKVEHTLLILEQQYMDSDILTLQEVSSSMLDQVRRDTSKLGQAYHVVAPDDLDTNRDQNSIILLSKAKFPSGSTREITQRVHSMFPEGGLVPVVNGDVLAIATKHVNGDDLVVASFHGDTNGLATIPVLDALVAAMKKKDDGDAGAPPPNAKLVFGLDANTYETGTVRTQDVMEWGNHYATHGLTSCWGDMPQKGNYTTYNARTYLQPQLNKACKRTEKREKGDVNPKDFILFSKSDYRVVKTFKDNTGQRIYKEDMAFPTLQFPSDHGILTTILEPLASVVEEAAA